MIFEASWELRHSEPVDVRVETPLGGLTFSSLSSGDRLAAHEALEGDASLRLCRYGDASIVVELLFLPFSPKIPAHMRVDGCVAAVWRAVALANGATFTARASWEPGARNQDGGGDGGEHLTAFTWDAPEVQVTLGASDEERLSYAAQSGFLPERLASVFADERAHFVKLVGERDGIEIALPPLLKGETAQVHMVVAWRTGEIREHECSAWFAVDVAPKEIARMADEALGRTA